MNNALQILAYRAAKSPKMAAHFKDEKLKFLEQRHDCLRYAVLSLPYDQIEKIVTKYYELMENYDEEELSKEGFTKTIKNDKIVF